MNVRLLKLVAFLAYASGLTNLFYFLNRKAKRIITFHNVLPEKLLPEGKRIGLVDTDTEFYKIVSEVRKHFAINNNLNDVGSATITFDDGYLNQAEIAGSILQKWEVPAIIFATGQNLNNSHPDKALVVDLLMHWVHLAPKGEYNLPPELYNKEIFRLGQDIDKTWQGVIWPAFNADKASKGHRLLGLLDAQFAIKDILSKCAPEYIRLRLGGLMDKNIEILTQKGWAIGWHTFSHYPLSQLSGKALKTEICDSPCYMQSVVMSYPYGELSSVNSECLKLAEKIYPGAVSNLPDKNQLSCQWFLPRYTLSENKYLLHFELCGLKNFIKTRHLL